MQQITFLLWLKLLFHTARPITGTDGLQALSWVQGSWVQAHAQDTTMEQWSMVGDSLISGAGVHSGGKGMEITEETALRLNRSATIEYVATVTNQNEQESVVFRLIKAKHHTWVFENPAHDFPQRIVYRQRGKKKMRAHIEGEINGKHAKEVFRYRRITEASY